MNRLTPQEAAGFARRYPFRGGRIRRVQLRYGRGGLTRVVLDLRLRTGSRGEGTLCLRLILERVAEFRFQMRPYLPRRIIEEARFGYWNGLFYLMLDATGLEPGEVARVHDYRASEVYVAGQELYWQERPGRGTTTGGPSAGPSEAPASE